MKRFSMRNSRRAFIAAVLFLAVVSVAAVWWSLSRRESSVAAQRNAANETHTTTVSTPTPVSNQTPMSNKKVSTPPSPCWFRKENDYRETDFYYERYSRMTDGYPKDIALSEALRIFNEEMRCYQVYDSFPLLTEGEVMAAAADDIVPDKDGDDEDLTKRNQNLRRVVNEKVMAKGLLLESVSSDASYVDSPEVFAPGVTKQFVFLYTGLDDNDMLCCVVNRKQRSLIRKLIRYTEPKK